MKKFVLHPAEAERIAKGGLAALGVPDAAFELRGRGKWIREKAVIAAVIRKRTGVGNLWIAGRLEMGHEGSVTRAVRWVREDSEGRKLEKSLEAMQDYRDCGRNRRCRRPPAQIRT